MHCNGWFGGEIVLAQATFGGFDEVRNGRANSPILNWLAIWPAHTIDCFEISISARVRLGLICSQESGIWQATCSTKLPGKGALVTGSVSVSEPRTICQMSVGFAPAGTVCPGMIFGPNVKAPGFSGSWM